jgi:hypothetical protein
VQESHSPSSTGAREQQASTSPLDNRRPQETERQPRSTGSLLSMLITGGLVAFAMAAMRALARDRDVTLTQHDRLEPGMTYDQVCAVVGRRGVDISVATGSPLFAWKNRDGSRLAAVFRDGQLLCYGHNGLK